MNYSQYWKPESIHQAKFLIDTSGEENFYKGGEKTAKHLKRFIPLDTKIVVEYGCGIGRILRHMPGHQIGIDVSQEMLNFGTQECGCEFILGDGRSIPLPDNHADFVYSWLVLQHMDAIDVIGVLKDTKRILTENGTFYHLFSAFGKDWSPNAVLDRGPLVWMGDWNNSSCGAHTAMRYTPEIIENVSKKAGLVVTKIESFSDASNIYAYFGLIGRTSRESDEDNLL